MPNDLLEFFQVEFGTRAAILAVSVFVTTLPFCIFKRTWPDVGHVAIMSLGSAGALSGVKITVLTIYLPMAQLGSLGDDKPALVLGGLATFVVSLREACSHWFKITH